MKTTNNSDKIRKLHLAPNRDPDILHNRVQEYYSKRLEEKWKGRHPMKGMSPGPNSILMRSNDYLCLAGDKRIIKAEIRALRKYGHGDSVSRIWVHHEQDCLHAFEKRIAKLMRAEAAVLCSSGYVANIGLIQSIARPDSIVYLDMKAHMSIWEGVSSARAKAMPFRHNDINHLERLIKKNGPGIIAVDSLYSTDGNVCPLEDVVAVSKKYNCPLIVDETHSFGTYGPNGSGMVVAKGLQNDVHFRTIGLSKAVASRGGIVICSERNAEFFRYEALPVIFSTSVLNHEVAGYNAVLDILETDDWRRKRLHKSHSFLRQNLDKLGYNIDNCASQIISLEAGEILQTVVLRDALESRDIFGSLFFPPAVPDKRCLIRFTVNCGLSNKQLHRIVDVCAEIRDEIKLNEWKSTKRKKQNQVTQNSLKTNAA